MRIVLATGNPHKVDEMRAIFAREGLAAMGVEVVGLKDLPDPQRFHEPEEHGTTFEENATIKALSYAQQTGEWCLADDSGLEIDALGGKPGVISSHYCTDGVDMGMTREQRDAANNERVLRELEGVPMERRAARFVCVMVLTSPPATRGGSILLPPLPPKHTFSQRLEKRHNDNLPHWQAAHAAYTITFRLKHGSMTPEERTIVLASCTHWHGSRVIIHVCVVMPDHVHLIVQPMPQSEGVYPSIPWFMQSIKWHSSQEMNRLRGTHGPVWQDEYYDTIVRDDEHMANATEYFLLNPVRKGLCDTWGEHPFTFLERDPRGVWKRREQNAPAPELGGRSTLLSRGVFEGRIGTPPRVPAGANGFGYDPLFLVAPSFDQTSAEMTTNEKNAGSHRAAAARAMAQHIAALARSFSAEA